MASNQFDRRAGSNTGRSPAPLKSILKQSGQRRRQPAVTTFPSSSLQQVVPQTQPPPQNKSVVFDRRTRVYLIPTTNEMRQEEYDACFFTDAESKEAQEEMLSCILAMRRGLNDNDEEGGLCFRGIEHMRSAASMSQRNEHKLHVTDSILDAQDEDEDPDHIAAVARRVTHWAVEAALTKASSDAAFVRRMQRNASRANLDSLSTAESDADLLRTQAIQDTLDEALSTSSAEDLESDREIDAAANNWHKRRRSFPRLTPPSTLALDLARCSIGKRDRSNSVDSALDQMSSRIVEQHTCNQEGK